MFFTSSTKASPVNTQFGYYVSCWGPYLTHVRVIRYIYTKAWFQYDFKESLEKILNDFPFSRRLILKCHHQTGLVVSWKNIKNCETLTDNNCRWTLISSKSSHENKNKNREMNSLQLNQITCIELFVR